MSYDAKSVNLPKSVKRMAATYSDPHKRGSYIKGYIKILEDDRQGRKPRNKGEK